MTRSPWHHTPRLHLSEKQAAKLFLERHGCCRECGRRLGPKDSWIVEHILALECGGSNDWHNLGITCTTCKPDKDARDHAQAAKQRDVATKHFLPKALRKKSALAKRDGMKFDWSQGRYVREDKQR